MTAFSSYLKSAVLNTVFRRTAFALASPPNNVYIALFTTNPGEDGASGELNPAVAQGYARVAMPTDTSFSAPALDGESNMVVTNTVSFEFPEALVAWPGTVNFFAIFDAETSGHMLFHGATPARTTPAGTIHRFIVGALKVKIG